MTLQEGPLVWPYLPVCDLADPSIGLTDQQRQMVVALAVEWLWSRSARRFGTRSVLFRPQADQQRHRGVLSGWVSGGYPGGGYDAGVGWCGDGDAWARQRVLELPPPAVSVENVTINGAILDPEAYRLDGRYLVRQDGGPWPQSQNMILALGNLDTWSVSYTRGVPVTTFGQYATGRLICYFAKRLAARESCELPYNTTSVTRRGVSISRESGKAGQTSPVPEVDQWLSMVNPNGLQAAPMVWSPDTARSRWPFAGSGTGQAWTPPEGQPSAANVLVLGPDEEVPAGTPAGTVILWTDGSEAVPAGVAPHLVVPLGAQTPAGVPPGTVILQTET